MMYIRKIGSPTSVALLGLLWGACDSPTGPTAGDLVVRLSTPNPDDRAAQLTIKCPQPPVSVNVTAGYLAYFDIGGSSATLIVIRQEGEFIPTRADVARVYVEDVSKPCSANLTSVSFQGYGLRTSLAGYSVSVLKP